MRNEKLYAVIRAAFFAALDYIFAMFQIHVPSPVGHPFVDLGFTFVALGTMFLGFKYGFISGAVGLGVFDLLNGYANHAYLTVMEVLLLTAAVALCCRFLISPLSCRKSDRCRPSIRQGGCHCTRCISGRLRNGIRHVLCSSRVLHRHVKSDKSDESVCTEALKKEIRRTPGDYSHPRGFLHYHEF